MPELVAVCIAVVAVIYFVINRDALQMPMSWDDDKEEYVRCYNCNAYIRESSGQSYSCQVCPFYRPIENEVKQDEEGTDDAE